MCQVDQMRHMIDKMYTEQLNLKSNLKFTFTKDASTNTIHTNIDDCDIKVNFPNTTPNIVDQIPATSFFSLGNYLNKKENK